MKKSTLSAIAAAAALTAFPAAAQNPFVGEVQWFGSNFCPNGWANADGSLLAISQNEALFALIGTTYGGDGQNTFALPDLRSRMPMHQGSNPFGTYVIGEQSGAETRTLTAQQLPTHNHAVAASARLRASAQAGDRAAPGGAVLANGGTTRAYAAGPANVDMGPALTASLQTQSAGQATPAAYNNLKPTLALTPCVALVGIFPSRP